MRLRNLCTTRDVHRGRRGVRARGAGRGAALVTFNIQISLSLPYKQGRFVGLLIIQHIKTRLNERHAQLANDSLYSQAPRFEVRVDHRHVGILAY